MALFTSHPDRENLDEKEVVSSWNTVMPNGGGHGEKFLEAIEGTMAELALPSTSVERKELTYKQYGSDVRPCIYIFHVGYKIYFSVQDFGKHLILSEIVSTIQEDQKNNTFQNEQVEAFFSCINGAKAIAVKLLADELKQDVSKMGVASKKGLIDIV